VLVNWLNASFCYTFLLFIINFIELESTFDSACISDLFNLLFCSPFTYYCVMAMYDVFYILCVLWSYGALNNNNNNNYNNNNYNNNNNNNNNTCWMKLEILLSSSWR
jgi:hypothetical protein